MDHVALKNELMTDPKALGFSEYSNDNDADNQWCADKLNEVGASGEIITRDLVKTGEIIEAICADIAEFNSLTDTEIMRINLFSSAGVIDPAILQSVFLELFPLASKPKIRAALIALATRPCSRAEKLIWPIITRADIHNARVS
jgi:hypothetical protein